MKIILLMKKQLIFISYKYKFLKINLMKFIEKYLNSCFLILKLMDFLYVNFLICKKASQIDTMVASFLYDVQCYF